MSSSVILTGSLASLIGEGCAYKAFREWMGNRSVSKAYLECPCGSWLLNSSDRLGVDRRITVRAACECARLVLDLASIERAQIEKGLKAVEAWCRGKCSIDKVDAAAAPAHNIRSRFFGSLADEERITRHVASAVSVAAEGVTDPAHSIGTAIWHVGSAVSTATPAACAAYAALEIANNKQRKAADAYYAQRNPEGADAAWPAYNEAQRRGTAASVAAQKASEPDPETMRKCADIVRKHISLEMFGKALEAYKPAKDGVAW